MSRLLDRGLQALEGLLLRSPASSAAGAPGLPRDWVGPRVEALLELPPRARHLALSGTHHPHGEAHRVLRVELRVEGADIGRFEVAEPGDFDLRLPLPAGLMSPIQIEVRTTPFFIPDEHLHNGDRRQLCFVLAALRLLE